ncbi:MAG TPA: hypothetical protein VNN08_21810, partial [Thermoanaerobaculia bacterium]|nr:hypothetical protein [Thermoanaerobaculia bacterium]
DHVVNPRLNPGRQRPSFADQKISSEFVCPPPAPLCHCFRSSLPEPLNERSERSAAEDGEG